jgi:hypothetical protein
VRRGTEVVENEIESNAGVNPKLSRFEGKFVEEVGVG